MKVELDKRDIIHLLRGVEPSYDTMGLIEDMELVIESQHANLK